MIYVSASLSFFRYEEKWGTLDCFYFSIITITTAGLGDFVPSNRSSKIVCSISIYLGVACIGLFLGSLLASAMDEISNKERNDVKAHYCANCTKKPDSAPNSKLGKNTKLVNNTNNQADGSTHIDKNKQYRHSESYNTQNKNRDRGFLAEATSHKYSPACAQETDSFTDDSVMTQDTLEPIENSEASKYVLLTLKHALLNSMLIVAIGAMGFYCLEDFDAVDSFYFTTVLLTTVGYGDFYPKTQQGKLFATIYILVAGTLLLNNMSSISMIPLELRRRRVELAVLGHFGNRLDDAALSKLSSGDLIKHLSLVDNNSNRLQECTRETFALAMLVRLGRIDDKDVQNIHKAFQRLDRKRDVKLNSGDIILGQINKTKSKLKPKHVQTYVTNESTSTTNVSETSTEHEFTHTQCQQQQQYQHTHYYQHPQQHHPHQYTYHPHHQFYSEKSMHRRSDMLMQYSREGYYLDNLALQAPLYPTPYFAKSENALATRPNLIGQNNVERKIMPSRLDVETGHINDSKSVRERKSQYI